MRSITELKDIAGKHVLVRVDFNLPIKDGQVEDDFRIKKALPTIEFLQKLGAKIILITHLGKGGESLEVVARALNAFVKAKFVKDILGQAADQAIREMANGEVILLENLRNDPGEKENSREFGERLAKWGDFYVNECFPVDHREDASIVTLPTILPSYAGFQLKKEVENLSHAFESPKHPFLFILGGAKFSTKIPLIEKYLDLADHVFIGGALLNVLLKAKGLEIGQSVVDDTEFDIGKVLGSEKIIWAVDVLVKSGEQLINKKIEDIKVDETILDVGTETVKLLAPVIGNAELILWNGPLGKFEDGGAEATKAVLKLVAASKAESILGGGETVVLITEEKMENDFSFVSSGGGATLDFLANGTLPGIKVLG